MCDAPHPEPNTPTDTEAHLGTVLEELLRATIHRHPLPWRVEFDWTVEVIDAKGERFVCFQLAANAEALVAAATRIAAQDAADSAECDAWFEAEMARVP